MIQNYTKASQKRKLCINSLHYSKQVGCVLSFLRDSNILKVILYLKHAPSFPQNHQHKKKPHQNDEAEILFFRYDFLI